MRLNLRSLSPRTTEGLRPTFISNYPSEAKVNHVQVLFINAERLFKEGGTGLSLGLIPLGEGVREEMNSQKR